jgi:CRISPR/Cas system CMR-associated protein Cmr5 small subunit
MTRSFAQRRASSFALQRYFDNIEKADEEQKAKYQSICRSSCPVKL